MDHVTGYLCYLDVLGFSSLYEIEEFKGIYDKLIEYVKDNFLFQTANFYTYFLSDSIVIISDNLDDVVDISLDLYSFGLKENIWMRGGLSEGIVTTIPDCKINKHILLPFLGNAYLKAYNLEKDINSAIINIDNSVAKRIENDLCYVYKEWFPKTGTPNEKTILFRDLKDKSIPLTHFANLYEKVLDTLPTEIEKYVNTICFYIKILMSELYSLDDVHTTLLKRFTEIFNEIGFKTIIPNEYIVIFIALIEEMMTHYHADTHQYEIDKIVREVITILREKGYLPIFMEYLKSLNKSRLIYDINKSLSR
ncbi:MAG: hypothetical protein SVW57_03155 [Thermodesulfobacteriota bacterium]|nr:hypothetical protein [Thermodesulfobacteriota bacterium]